MKNLILSFGILLAVMCSLLISHSANLEIPKNFAGRWELLGSRTVNFGLDRDEIMVTANEGFFTALKFKVERSALNLHRMVVHFGDGSTQDVELRNNLKAGQESRIIDLEGNRRVITKVVFVYDTKNKKKARAVIELWGRH